VCSDRKLDVRLIAEKLNMNRETVRQIIAEDLGMGKMMMVPRNLTDDQKQCWPHIPSDLLHNAEMFDKVITGDETWSIKSGNKRPEQAVENTEFMSAEKKHACLTCSSRSCLCVSSITRG
jgi:hypothetical protein